MDILNFISWIRGGRKFTNVDPATTLVPVGVRDNSRDDKYLTGGISVEDLAAQIGGGSIEIPKVITKPLQGTIQTQLDFYQTTEWQQHNPKLFLFRQKSKKKKTKNVRIARVRRPEGRGEIKRVPARNGGAFFSSHSTPWRPRAPRRAPRARRCAP